jgi:hypothetical protein
MSARDWAESRYSRVYASITTDPKFATVYDNDPALAAWVRLLLIADAAWPDPAAVPRRTNQAALDHLAGVGLVDILPGDLYLMRGLDAERQAKAEQATQAGKRRAALGVRNTRGQYVKDQRPLDVSPAPDQRPLDNEPATIQLTGTETETETEQPRPATAGDLLKKADDDAERAAEKAAQDEYIRSTGIRPDPRRPSHPEKAAAMFASIRTQLAAPQGTVTP